MGTHALIYIEDKRDVLVTIYVHYDGYPKGLGHDIYNALYCGKARIVNGINPTAKNIFNGMGDLAAHLIKELKHETGNVYIYPTSSPGDGIDYTYVITEYENKAYMSINGQGFSLDEFPKLFLSE